MRFQYRSSSVLGEIEIIPYSSDPQSFFYLIHPRNMTKLLPTRYSKWQPTPGFLPGKFHGQRGLVGCRPWGCKGSATTEHLSRVSWDHDVGMFLLLEKHRSMFYLNVFFFDGLVTPWWRLFNTAVPIWSFYWCCQMWRRVGSINTLGCPGSQN